MGGKTLYCFKNFPGWPGLLHLAELNVILEGDNCKIVEKSRMLVFRNDIGHNNFRMQCPWNLRWLKIENYIFYENYLIRRDMYFWELFVHYWFRRHSKTRWALSGMELTKKDSRNPLRWSIFFIVKVVCTTCVGPPEKTQYHLFGSDVC